MDDFWSRACRCNHPIWLIRDDQMGQVWPGVTRCDQLWPENLHYCKLNQLFNHYYYFPAKLRKVYGLLLVPSVRPLQSSNLTYKGWPFCVNDHMWPVVTIYDKLWPYDQVWPAVTRCDQMWPGVTSCNQLLESLNNHQGHHCWGPWQWSMWSHDIGALSSGQSDQFWLWTSRIIAVLTTSLQVH